MSFLNSKEQVIDLQLTQYGKYLLSVGKFKPASYAFYDDDILYDSGFASITESQNNIEGRIQEETPYLSTQYMYRGAETAIFSSAPNIVNDLMPGAGEDLKKSFKIQATPDRTLVLQNPIGTSNFNSDKAVAWNVGFYKAELKSANNFLTGSRKANIRIPQLECDIQYYIKRFAPNEDEEESDEARQEDLKDSGDGEIYETVDFDDGSKIIVQDDYAFLLFEEANSVFSNKNFDIEFFEVIEEVTDTGNSSYSKSHDETLRKLFFMENDFDEPETNNVEYYFDIEIDTDIPEEIFCSNINIDKIKNIYTDDIFKCLDVSENVSLDIYNTEEEDPGEIC